MKRAILIRLVELMLSGAAVSALSSALFSMENFKGSVINVSIVLACACIFFIVFNISRMRICFWEVRKYKKFCKIMFGSYLLYALIGYAAYALLGAKAHMWVFGMAKVFTALSAYKVETLVSVTLFHVIMLVITLVSPIGVPTVD